MEDRDHSQRSRSYSSRLSGEEIERRLQILRLARKHGIRRDSESREGLPRGNHDLNGADSGIVKVDASRSQSLASPQGFTLCGTPCSVFDNTTKLLADSQGEQGKFWSFDDRIWKIRPLEEEQKRQQAEQLVMRSKSLVDKETGNGLIRRSWLQRLRCRSEKERLDEVCQRNIPAESMAFKGRPRSVGAWGPAIGTTSGLLVHETRDDLESSRIKSYRSSRSTSSKKEATHTVTSSKAAYDPMKHLESSRVRSYRSSRSTPSNKEATPTVTSGKAAYDPMKHVPSYVGHSTSVWKLPSPSTQAVQNDERPTSGLRRTSSKTGLSKPSRLSFAMRSNMSAKAVPLQVVHSPVSSQTSFHSPLSRKSVPSRTNQLSRSINNDEKSYARSHRSQATRPSRHYRSTSPVYIGYSFSQESGGINSLSPESVEEDFMAGTDSWELW